MSNLNLMTPDSNIMTTENNNFDMIDLSMPSLGPHEDIVSAKKRLISQKPETQILVNDLEDGMMVEIIASENTPVKSGKPKLLSQNNKVAGDMDWVLPPTPPAIEK